MDREIEIKTWTIIALLMASICASASATPIVVSGGSNNDYESDIFRLSDGRLIVIFDRNPDWASGDLYVTFSSDNGVSWDVPQAIIMDDGDQATLSFVQTPDDSIRLWYASNETGTYRIYEAISADGLTWVKIGAPDLGWEASVDYYDPKVILEDDGSFTMSYVVSGAGVYIAHKLSAGLWDTYKLQISTSGYRARVMKHSNGKYLYAYHKRTGTTYEYDVFVTTSTDRVNWTAPLRLTSNMNSHDPCPGQMSDGAFIVYYAKYEGSAYNLHRRRSYNAADWFPEEKITFDPTNNTQPHFLVEGDGVYLVWAHAVNYPDDHDVYFERSADNYSIASLSPLQNELDVSVATDISVTFDKDMDSTTVDESTFKVWSRCNGSLQGSISYHVPSRTAQFQPTFDFQVGDIPCVLLSNEILTEYGSPMGRNFVWNFTVETGGHGNFIIGAAYDVEGWQTSLCAADLNGDRETDLAVTSNNSIQLLINDGDGSFIDAGLIQAAWDPHIIRAADLDGDGDVDLIGGGEGGEYETYAVIILNNGDGSFALPVDYMAGTPGFGAPTSIAALDFDGDSDIDIAIDCPGVGSIAVLLNYGDGSFSSSEYYSAGEHPTSVQAADLDLDGDVDLVSTNEYFGSISVLPNVGDGTFGIYDPYYPPGGNPVGIALADLDGDGDVDIVSAHESLSVGSLSIGLNQGNGEIGLGSNLPAGDVPSSIETGDFDGDGDIDIVTTYASSDSLRFFANNGDATFVSTTAFELTGTAQDLTSADLDGDGDLDLAVAYTSAEGILILLNEGYASGCGDVDQSGGVDIDDAVFLINYIFAGGPAPDPLAAGDVNCSSNIDIDDVVYLIQFIFAGGSEPCDVDGDGIPNC